MYHYKTPTRSITIDAGYGVYVFYRESATGKTRLRHWLNYIRQVREPVATLVYDAGSEDGFALSGKLEGPYLLNPQQEDCGEMSLYLYIKPWQSPEALPV